MNSALELTNLKPRHLTTALKHHSRCFFTASNPFPSPSCFCSAPLRVKVRLDFDVSRDAPTLTQKLIEMATNTHTQRERSGRLFAIAAFLPVCTLSQAFLCHTSQFHFPIHSSLTFRRDYRKVQDGKGGGGV